MFQIHELQKRLNECPNVRPLAKKSGLSERTVYRVKKGEKLPTVNTAIKLFEALEALYPVKPRKAPVAPRPLSKRTATRHTAAA
jgi:predicted transcriptional regulator